MSEVIKETSGRISALKVEIKADSVSPKDLLFCGQQVMKAQ